MRRKNLSSSRQTRWSNLYFHNFDVLFLFGIKRKRGMKEEERDGGIRKATEVFLLLFLELVNMFVLHRGILFGLN